MLESTYYIPEDLDAIRQRLDYLPSKTPNYPQGIQGVRLIQRSTERPDGEDCQGFVFGNTDGTIAASESFLQQAILTPPVVDAVAFYRNARGILRHVGLVIDVIDETTTIRSKWGRRGHVYEHAVGLVPSRYGNKVTYYRRRPVA